jgi:thioredoxin-like negative regulator of GroEL
LPSDPKWINSSFASRYCKSYQRHDASHPAPEVKRVATAMAGRAIVLKVDTERSPVVAQRFNVMSIPNFVVMKNGRIINQQPGLVDHRQMIAWLTRQEHRYSGFSVDIFNVTLQALARKCLHQIVN